MSRSRLPERVVLRHLDDLSDDLSPRQLERLRALAGLLDESGLIPLERALQIATPGGDERTSLAAFRQFRRTARDAALVAGVDLDLVVDGRKTSPRTRVCWFEGEDATRQDLADRSQRESRRTTRDQPVDASVAEVLDAIVYVSTPAEARPQKRKLESEFIELLRERLAVRRDRAYQVTSCGGIELGQEISVERAQQRAQADIVLCLVSSAYLAGNGGDANWAAAWARRRPVFVAFEGLPPGSKDTTEVPLAEIRLQGRPFDRRTTAAARQEFVDDCLQWIADRLAEPARVTHLPIMGEQLLSESTAAATYRSVDMSGWAEDRHRRHAIDTNLVPQSVSETMFGDLSVVGESGAVHGLRKLGTAVPAVDRLVAWALDKSPGARYMCALLGDVGMGKTTTTKLLTDHLLKRRRADRATPLPILFDLRNLSPEVARDGANLRRIIEALLDTGDISPHRPSAEDVLYQVSHGDCVLIFDGLDEVLVHLTPHQGQLFTRTLWRATEDSWQNQSEADDGGEGKPRPSKLLLSCRTHYFRSIHEERTHFTGQHRDGPAASDYLALLMLPFNEGQIRAYLRDNLPGHDADTMFELIEGVHNLREIAERPLTLRMITEQLEAIERAKLTGRVVHAVDLYASFVADWLARDHPKHVLLPEHKQLLMEHLAAELWRSGRTAWTTDDVEQWLLNFMAARPELELHYQVRQPDLWKEDLRTATFLIRRDDDHFAFAHTSLREYFLSRHLLRALDTFADVDTLAQRWNLPVPSRETLAFLGQHLAGSSDLRLRNRRAALSALARNSSTSPQGTAAAVLAFAYGLVAAQEGYPNHSLAGSRVDGANLRAWRIHAADGMLLDLRGSSFVGADLTGAFLRGVHLDGGDLSAANLTRAELHDSVLRAVTVRAARLNGTVFRHCDVRDTRWGEARAYRTQALHCYPPHEPASPGWHRAPIGDTIPSNAHRLTSFTGHRSALTAGGFSPDGSRILTTDSDGTTSIWDAVTGEQTLVLPGRSDRLLGSAFSRDGSRLLTMSSGGMLRVWDVRSGEQLWARREVLAKASGGAFSPDGGQVMVTSLPDTMRVWDVDTEDEIQVGCHAPQHGREPRVTGSRVLVTAGEATWVWDPSAREITRSGYRNASMEGGLGPIASRRLVKGADGAVWVWDSAEERAVLALPDVDRGVIRSRVSLNGTRVSVTSLDGRLRIWDLPSRLEVLTLSGSRNGITWEGLSPDGNRLIVPGNDGVAQILDVESGETVLTLSAHREWFTSGTFGPDGNRTLTTGSDGAVRIWDAASGYQLTLLIGHDASVSGGAFSPDGMRLVSSSSDGTARIWDAASGRTDRVLSGHGASVTSAVFDRDGRWVLTASQDKTARIWEAVSGETSHVLTGHEAPVTQGVFSPDGRWVLTTSHDRTARLWEASSGRWVRTLSGVHTNGVTAGHFSPDGSLMLTTSNDRTGVVWDASSDQYLATLSGHAAPVTSGRFSLDGRRILTTSDDGTARIWEVATGALALELAHPGPVTGGDFSPDGAKVVTTSYDGTVRIWDAYTGQPVGWRGELLPDAQVAAWSTGGDERLLNASPGAWRWLGWLVHVNGVLTRLPAETYGTLGSTRPLGPRTPDLLGTVIGHV